MRTNTYRKDTEIVYSLARKDSSKDLCIKLTYDNNNTLMIFKLFI